MCVFWHACEWCVCVVLYCIVHMENVAPYPTSPHTLPIYSHIHHATHTHTHTHIHTHTHTLTCALSLEQEHQFRVKQFENAIAEKARKILNLETEVSLLATGITVLHLSFQDLILLSKAAFVFVLHVPCAHSFTSLYVSTSPSSPLCSCPHACACSLLPAAD